MSQKVAIIHVCDFCDYTTSNKFDFNKHLSTRIHKRKQMETTWKPNIATPSFECETCGKQYSSRAGLWKHKKTRHSSPEQPSQQPQAEQSTADLRAEMMEMMKLILDRIGNSINNSYNTTNNNNNNTNNNLTVNFFLNETCKNAMNMSDLISRINPSIEKVFAITDTTYAKHTASLFIDALNNIDPTERPIHCSDSKRNQYYVKSNNVWTKDSGEKLEHAFTQMESKQIQQLKEWEKENPDWIDDDKKSIQYMKTLNQILGGNDEKDYEKNKKEAARMINENISLKTAMSDVA